MLIYVQDVVSEKSIAINPEHIVSVLTVPEGEHKDKTAVVLLNGNVIVDDEYLELVGRINSELIK